MDTEPVQTRNSPASPALQRTSNFTLSLTPSTSILFSTMIIHTQRVAFNASALPATLTPPVQGAQRRSAEYRAAVSSSLAQVIPPQCDADRKHQRRFLATSVFVRAGYACDCPAY